MAHLTSSFDPRFLYCERTGEGLFNEPLNVMSCAVFLVTAWLLWRDYSRTRTKCDEERLTLIALMTLTGLGGMFMHTTASRLGIYAELVPQGWLVTFVFYVTLRRLLGIGRLPTLMLVLGFSTVSALTQTIGGPYRFHDAVVWFPLLAAVVLITWSVSRMSPAAPAFLIITGLVVTAVMLYFADSAVCSWLPTGTYFLGEICMAMAMYMVARTISEPRHAGRS